jgi:hypothetical protein
LARKPLRAGVTSLGMPRRRAPDGAEFVGECPLDAPRGSRALWLGRAQLNERRRKGE